MRDVPVNRYSIGNVRAFLKRAVMAERDSVSELNLASCRLSNVGPCVSGCVDIRHNNFAYNADAHKRNGKSGKYSHKYSGDDKIPPVVTVVQAQQRQ